MNMEIKMPQDMVEGSDCLKYHVPWQVPESIFKESEALRGDDMVLEVGTGGSTIFFADRCKFVTAIETSVDWGKKVFEELAIPLRKNFLYFIIEDEDRVCDQIKEADLSKITVFSVDTEGNYNRSKILNAFLSKGISESLRMLVIDNYSHEGLFPDHHDKLIIDSPDWEVFTYNHERWAGSGTRLYIKKDK